MIELQSILYINSFYKKKGPGFWDKIIFFNQVINNLFLKDVLIKIVLLKIKIIENY